MSQLVKDEHLNLIVPHYQATNGGEYDYEIIEHVITGATLGGSINFPITDRNNKIHGISWKATFSALTKTGGTYIRLIPSAFLFGPNSSVSRGNVAIMSDLDNGIRAHHENMLFNDSDHSYAIRKLGGDYADAAARNAASAAEQTVFYNENNHWIGSDGYMYYGNNSPPLSVSRTLRSIADLVDTDGTAPVGTLVSLSIRLHVSRPTHINPTKITADLESSVFNTLHLNSYSAVFDAVSAGNALQSLSALNGRTLAFMWFVVHRKGTQTNDDEFGTTAITDWAIKSSVTNVFNKGNIMTHIDSKEVIQQWVSNPVYSYDNHVYMWSFVPSPAALMANTAYAGGLLLDGTESLRVKCPTLTGSYSVSAHFYTYATTTNSRNVSFKVEELSILSHRD